MEIGIDIDDTLVVTYEPMLRYADKFNEEKFGVKKLKDNIGNIATHHYLSAIFEWDDETKFEFFRKYYADVLKECKIKEYAAEAVRKLKEAGHKIYFISARLTNIEGCDAKGITLDALSKYNVPFDKLVVDAEEKVRDSISLGVDIFVEDSLINCQKLSNAGIKTYLITSKINANLDSGDIERVDNWKELYEKITSYYEKNKDKIVESR